MIKTGVFLVAVGLFLLLPSIVNVFDFFPQIFFMQILAPFGFPADISFGLIVYYGISLALIGFGIKKIISGWKNII